MATSATSNCGKCGSNCHGRLCRNCEQTERQESLDLTYGHPECPDCGGETSATGVTCYKCRGGR